MTTQAGGAVDWREGLRAILECKQGKPMRFKRLFLKVKDKVTGEVVPYVPTANQRRMHDLTFGRFNVLKEGFDASLYKARKAQSTTEWVSDDFALQCVNENVDALHATDSDDTTKSVLDMWDTFYNNMPDPLFTVPAGVLGPQEVIIGRPRKGLWNTEQRGFVFGDEAVVKGELVFSQRAASTTYFSSFKSTNFSRSFTPLLVIRSEWAHAEKNDAPAFDQSVRGSRPPGRGCVIDESTGNGPDTMHVQAYKTARAGQSGTIILIFYWYQDGTNRLREESQHVIQADRGLFPLTEDELEVRALPDFPRDISEEEVRDMFRWRRYEMRLALEQARTRGGDRDMAEAIFHQEHMERESDIAVAPQLVSPFSAEEKRMLRSGIRPPMGKPEGEFLAPRFWVKQYYPRASGHRYILTMDPSKTGATDPCVMKLFDADADTEVCRFEGGVHPKLALEAALGFVRKYASDGPQGNFKDVWFVWERNTVGNDLRDYASEMGFPIGQMWLDPKERDRTNAEWQYGWNNSPVSKGEMLRMLVLRAKERKFILSDEQSVNDLLNYDFDANIVKTIDHTPDGVICDGLYSRVKDELCPTRVQSVLPDRTDNLIRFPVAAGRGGYASRLPGVGGGLYR